MKAIRYSILLSALVLAGGWSAELVATKLLHMNLEKLCENSDRVFLGTLVEVSQDSVQAGGGTISALKYVFTVEHAFKGQFQTQKGVQIAEFKMIGSLKQHESGRGPIPGFPVLKNGQRYVVMLNPDGPVGLTTTVGLGQGCFEIHGREGHETASNFFNNAGLFRGMSVSGAPAGGPVSYSVLAGLIGDIVGGGN